MKEISNEKLKRAVSVKCITVVKTHLIFSEGEYVGKTEEKGL